MPTGRVFVSLLLCSLLVATSVSLTAQTTDKDLAADLTDFLTSSEPARRDAARDRLLARPSEDVTRMESLLASGSIYSPRPTGAIQEKVHVDFDDSNVDCTVFVPPAYDHAKPYPLLVVMYGGLNRAQRWQKALANKEDFLIVSAPRPAGANAAGYASTESERQVPLAVIRRVRQLYHVDSNRVYITGFSIGGHGTWDNLLCYTDHYAAGIVESGIPAVEGYTVSRSCFFPNLFQTGIYVMAGTPDQDTPGFNRDSVDRLKKLHVDAVYVEFPDHGHNPCLQGQEDALKWLLPHKRDPWPRSVTKVAHRLVQARAWWLRAQTMKGPEWDPNARISVKTDVSTPKSRILDLAAKVVDKHFIHLRGKADAKTNVVSVTATHVGKLTVFLHPSLVDFSRNVRVTVNNRTLFNGPVKPDPKTLLDAASSECDFQFLPHASITVDVP